MEELQKRCKLKDHWKLSCFMEYSNGVAAGRIDLAKGAPMLAACAGILGECDAAFLRWYATLHPVPRGAARALTRLQSFVTRYRPNPDETHLPRHIDGANVEKERSPSPSHSHSHSHSPLVARALALTAARRALSRTGLLVGALKTHP